MCIIIGGPRPSTSVSSTPAATSSSARQKLPNQHTTDDKSGIEDYVQSSISITQVTYLTYPTNNHHCPMSPYVHVGYEIATLRNEGTPIKGGTAQSPWTGG